MTAPTTSPHPLALWRDRTGAFSWLRAVALALAVLPALPLVWRIAASDLGPRPLTEVSHVTGLWAIRLLAATMAVTPLIEILRQPRLVAMRRILGVSVFVWMVAHFVVFVADKSFDPGVVVHELFARIYLLIGLAALLMLAALAATSTDGAVRKLGAQRWKALHRLVYAIVLLGLVHFFMQSKLDVTEPTAMAGIFALLGLLRLPRRFGRALTPAPALALAVATTALVALIEAGYYALAMGAPFGALIAADFSLELGVRPCWAPMAVGVAFVVAALVARMRKPQGREARSPLGRAPT
ncbi:MAG: ferric reductase-like transmembrane domain-containing protein [Methylobacteriaceae bacterium]|nr:ferric reductase-like transmembrane domain-containing protein [Rhodoblastus sp.]MCC0004258.1 ferric reductase-like transmembrane domain-containing protein [Methylobacteriaceae bacterium]